MTYGTESYMHKAAKDTLANWLRDSTNHTGDGRYDHEFFDVRFRSNRSAPHFGVVLECPFVQRGIYGDNSLSHLWDESCWASDLYGGGDEYGNHPKHVNPPTYEECVKLGYRVEYIFDIVTFHKGMVNNVIEVVHKHDVPEGKIRICREFEVKLFRVSANRVLSQIGVPTRDIMERLA